jgi:hypothetical protein
MENPKGFHLEKPKGPHFVTPLQPSMRLLQRRPTQNTFPERKIP